jgi:Asp/Glu/hydantoin racemase
MQTTIAFVHTSPAAIPPLMQFYSREAPELAPVNLLEDGILRMLSAGRREAAMDRLSAMIAAARDEYGAGLALTTCSSFTSAQIGSLAAGARMPVLKIDQPMARRAAAAGRRIGVAITFEPTVETTRRLLLDEAPEADLRIQVVAGAYRALLDGDADTHDGLLLEGVRRLEQTGVDCIVLAQVSMARVLAEAQRASAVPVFSSLETSLEAVRAALRATASHG